MLSEAHPLPISAADLATASKAPEISINASLQLLYEQGAVSVTADGRHFVEDGEAPMPEINLGAVNERHRRAEDRLRKMLEYASAHRCRRAQILGYFGQKFEPPCNDCDVCCGDDRKPQSIETQATPETDRVARIILEATVEANGRVGRLLVGDALAGSRRKRIVTMGVDKLKHYAALKVHRRQRITDWIMELIDRRLLETTAEEYPRLVITSSGRAALESDALISLDGFSTKRREEKTEVKVEDTEAEKGLFEELRQWRLKKVQSLGIAPFMILHDSVVKEIVRHQPRAMEELSRIKGIGPNKAARFGEEILSIINDAGDAHEPPREDIEPGRDEQDFDDPFLQIEMWHQGGSSPDVERLMAALEDPSALERGGLIVVIGALKDLRVREATGKLIDLLRETDDGNLITTLCAALARFESAEAISPMIDFLDDHRPGVRRAAARALGSLRVKEAIEKLKRIADEDSSQSTRLAARAAVSLISAGAKIDSPTDGC